MGTRRERTRDVARSGTERRQTRGTTAQTGADKAFGSRARRWGLLWIAANVGLGAALGPHVDGERAYLFAWCALGALLLVTALALSIVAHRRTIEAETHFWKLFGLGCALCLLIGVLVLLKLAFSSVTWDAPVLVVVAAPAIGVPLVVLCAVTFYRAMFDLIRARSTVPATALDIIESAMLVIALCAFAPLVWGNHPIVTSGLWFGLPAGVAAIAILAGVCWSMAMFRRVKGRIMPDEKLGLAIGFVCGFNAVVHTAQGLTGFSLPSTLGLVCQAACFGVVCLNPLFLATTAHQPYDTLPPVEQSRARPLDTLAIALLVPLLLVTIARQPALGWAVWYFVGVALCLLMLATLRGKLAMRDARRLYGRVEEAADARRDLLADVLRSADHDRHRVAAQLHQQATAFFVTLTASLRRGDDVPPAVARLREDLEHQAEELRALMLAVRPLDAEAATADLRSTIAAYIYNLYADAAMPQVDIQIDDALDLDWTTETIVMRILQEALRNVAKHAMADHVIVSIDGHDEGVSLSVLDDGVGFDAKALLFESGNDYMRRFASHLGGHVYIDSTPGRGTEVRAVVGTTPAVERVAAPVADALGLPGRRPHLRVVTDAFVERAVDDPEVATAAEWGTGRSALAARRTQPSVHTRLSERRAASSGRRFLHFKHLPSQAYVRDALLICAVAFLALPPAIVASLSIGARSDSVGWTAVSMVLFGGVIASLGIDYRRYRRGEWDKFDPRTVFARSLVSLFGAAAFGVAIGGELALFGPILLIVVLFGAVIGSRPFVIALWATSVAIVLGVLLHTRPDSSTALWGVMFYAFSSALVTGIVDLTLLRARDGLASLETVADFTAQACSMRDWDATSEAVLHKIARSVDATTIVAYERPLSDSTQLREIGRWSAAAVSPFLDSELRRLAERTRGDGELEVSRFGRSHLTALAASTTSTDLVLAADLNRAGPRHDAALLAAVSSLASVVDRSGLIEELLGEARTDPLTGLANRRQLRDFLLHAIGRAERCDEPMTVAMLDLDHFKRFNDTFGHVAGDRVLVAFADQLRARLRAQDVAARFGGEEFCLLLPRTTTAEAQVVIEDLRLALSRQAGERVTFSAGVAQARPLDTGEDLIERADGALYQAKAEGRDRLVLAP